MQTCHFRRFRQNGTFLTFLAGDKNTVYQKRGFCHPEDRARQGLPVVIQPVEGATSVRAEITTELILEGQVQHFSIF